MLLFIAVLAAAPGPAHSVPPPAWLASLPPCERAIVLDQPDIGAKEYRAAQHSNRVADYQAFLAAYPSSVCAENAQEYIQRRKDAIARIAAAPKVPAPVAIIHGSLGDLFTADDYPPSAIRAGEQGKVVAEWDISPDGYVENCRISASSGSQVLDAVTCSLIVRRARYEPARDAAGAPITSTAHTTMNWRIPIDAPHPASNASPN